MSFLTEIVDKINQNTNQGVLINTSETQEKSSPTEVILKEGQLDTSKIVEYKSQELKKFEFRPTNFSQFIGQEEAKERLKTVIKKNERGLKSHFLIDGIKGHGKTTIVELFSKEINAHIIKRIGKQIEIDNVVEIINEINTTKNKNIVLFIDEFDTMDWKVIKTLNPIIESFEISGKKIKPFIFAGATINKYLLIKKNPDTLDRIPTHIKFKRYNTEEIKLILKQYLNELYPDESISEETLTEIGNNCKFNPRTCIALLEEFIVEQNIKKVLYNCNIVKNGLNTTDIKILQTLNKTTKPMGCNALAQRCGLSQNEYVEEFEPYLCEYEYINRIPSRMISDKGKELLNTITGV